MDTETFRFAYQPGTIRFGGGCVADLGSELAEIDAERALVVTGKTVGTNDAVVGPVREGLGERLVDVFAGTTPESRLDTAFDIADEIVARDVDVVVGLGGGSSLDVATVATVLAAADLPRTAVYETFAEKGTIPIPDDPILPMVAIPTTLAGADLSTGAGMTLTRDLSPSGERVDGLVDDPRLMPSAVFADPEIVATTPSSVLHASAMNGFDKGIESLYSHLRNPITDAAATRGLELLQSGLPALGRGRRDAETMERVVVGNLLVLYGAAQHDGRTMSIIHAFGNGLAKGYDVQQGVAHAIAAPHALDYVFEQVDGRRHLMGDALGVPASLDDEHVARANVDAVTTVRDALDLPSRIRDVDGPKPEEFPEVAEAISRNGKMQNGPRDLDPTTAEIESLLEAMW